MLAPLDTPVDTHAFTIAPEGRNRGYGLVCTPDAALRPFAAVDLVSQLWRPSGLPIRKWFSPLTAGTTGPVAQQDRGLPTLRDFEDEAFAGRGRDDGENRRDRIPAAPGRSGAPAVAHLLRREDWPRRTATWLRHRIALRSRYAGILREPKPLDLASQQGDWDFSVAILADATGPGLTRPLIHAFLPLPQRGARDAGSVAPPLLALLDEPPMAQLGLAERITAEIRTTRRFGFDVNGVQKLAELRKEIGPDPRLRCSGIGAAKSRQATLICEGPFGLHFEGDATVAPRFVNTQLLMHPQMDGATDLEETFVAIALRRIADPAWCWPPEPAGGMACWLPLSATGLELSDGHGPLVRVIPENGALHVRLRNTALWEEEPRQPPDIPLCSVGPGVQAALLLHQHDDGSADLMVVQRPGQLAEAPPAEGLQDRAVGSVRLVTHGPVVVPPGQAAFRTIMSPSTSVEWLRTARDAGRFRIGSEEGDVVSLDDGTVTAALAPEGDGFRIGFFHEGQLVPLQSPPMAGPRPLGLHRHLAVLATRTSDTAGRARQLFAEARMADFNGFSRIEGRWPGLRLIEFETPAQVLLSQGGANGMPHLQDFERAYCDLISTLPAGNMTAGVRLAIRAVSRPILVGEGLRFSILPPDQVGLPDQPATFLTFTCPFDTRGLILQRGQGGWQLWAQGVTGLQPIPLNGTTGQALPSGGFDLSLGTDSANSLFADVSLLHGPAADNQPYPAVEFGWFFGQPEGGSIAEAVHPDRLNLLAEAQARIVLVTEPIPVRD